jgi:heme oxygenase (mycobilin-producing)
MVKVMIKRKAPEGREAELLSLITDLRCAASRQLGYISGETLRSGENPSEYLVISVWRTENEWDRWIATDERRELQDRIDALIGTPTKYEIYRYPHVVHDP